MVHKLFDILKHDIWCVVISRDSLYLEEHGTPSVGKVPATIGTSEAVLFA